MTTYIPKLWDVGISLPDPTLDWDPTTKVWSYQEPDWQELADLVKGEPSEATASRLAWKQALARNNDWIREVVLGEPAPVLAA